MTWFKLDDRFFDNPKIAALSDRAKVAYLEAGTYCARELTDGYVPLQKARAFAASAKALKELTPHLWEPVDGGFRVHDFLKYNPRRDQVMTERGERHDAKVRAGKAGAARRWGSSEIAEEWQADSTTDSTKHSPVKPVSPSLSRDPETPMPDLPNEEEADALPFEPEPEEIPNHLAKPKRGAVKKLADDDVLGMYDMFPQLDVQREATKFRDYVVAKRPKYVDEPAAFRNWLRGAEERAHGRNQTNVRQPRGAPGPDHVDRAAAARALGIGGGR